MKKKNYVFLILVILLKTVSFDLMAEIYTVSTAIEYHEAEQKAHAGDTISWQSGTFTDIDLSIKKNHIHVRAQTPGKTIFTGASKVEIVADSVTFSGFQFTGGKVEKDICKLSGSYNLIEHVNFSDYHAHFYLNIVPGCKHNTIQYCNFEKKPEDKPTSVVQIQADEKQPGYHTIKYCSFKNHTAPPGAGGDYGIEALRIGYSFQAKFISRTIVEYCYFYKCNGDGEVISSKARENIFRYNTFDDNGESHFTLRHGSDNVVYGNFFLKGAGLRIKEGQNQMVYNNYFNTGNYFSVRLENYKVDPLENIIITHNTFYESGPVRLGGKGDHPPAGVVLSHNLFWNPVSDMLIDPTGKETVFDNATTSEKVITAVEGFYPVTAKIENNAYGYLQPVKIIAEKGKSMIKSPMLDIPFLDDDPGIALDISGNTRGVNITSEGCYEPGKNHRSLKPHATAQNTGPGYLR